MTRKILGKIPNQYSIKWSCRYCRHYHQEWRDSIDIPEDKFEVKCKKCSSSHQIKVYKNQSSTNTYCEILNPNNDNRIFLNIGIDNFKKFMPETEVYPHNSILSREEFYQRWSQHDAIHFISGSLFDDEGERKVAYIEKKLNCGWYPFNEYGKTELPCDYEYITEDLLNETSKQLLNSLSIHLFEDT